MPILPLVPTVQERDRHVTETADGQKYGLRTYTGGRSIEQGESFSNVNQQKRALAFLKALIKISVYIEDDYNLDAARHTTHSTVQ